MKVIRTLTARGRYKPKTLLDESYTICSYSANGLCFAAYNQEGEQIEVHLTPKQLKLIAAVYEENREKFDQ